MPAYVIANVEVTDPEAYEEYRRHVPGTLELYGGRFLVRGGEVEQLEGSWEPHRLVVLEFESVEAARRWYGSPEYQAIIGLRQRTSNGDLVLVEGYDATATR